MRDVVLAAADLLEGGADSQAVGVLLRAAVGAPARAEADGADPTPAPRPERKRSPKRKRPESSRRLADVDADEVRQLVAELEDAAGGVMNATAMVGCSRSSWTRWRETGNLSPARLSALRGALKRAKGQAKPGTAPEPKQGPEASPSTGPW